MKIVLLILLMCVLVECRGKPQPDDANLTRILVGTWITDPAAKTPDIGTSTYNADGTGSEALQKADGTIFRVNTHWSIKKGILSLKSDTWTDKERSAIDFDVKDLIVIISEDRLEYEAFEGYGEAKGMRSIKIRKK
jgi:hypothetical protein